MATKKKSPKQKQFKSLVAALQHLHDLGICDVVDTASSAITSTSKEIRRLQDSDTGKYPCCVSQNVEGYFEIRRHSLIGECEYRETAKSFEERMRKAKDEQDFDEYQRIGATNKFVIGRCWAK